MQDHWKKHNHKIDSFILGNPQGEENPAKLPLYNMYKRQSQKQVVSSFYSLSLSLLCATQVSVSVFKWEAQPLYLYSFYQLTFTLNKSAPLNFSKKYFILFIRVLIGPTYNGGFTSWLYDDQLQ